MMFMGTLHFVADDLFVQVVPPWMPAPMWCVWLSGVAELALGVGLLPVRMRRLAGLGLVALYVAVFPANLYMAVADVQIQGLPAWVTQPTPLQLWLRLPFQLVFIAWALYVSRLERPSRLER